MVVVLPAPLGPRRPTISPLPTEKEMSSTALKSPYSFVRPGDFQDGFSVCSPNGVLHTL